MTKETVDFIGIGAQKAGTTWLWNLLRVHPDIWMPHKKELHYFDRSLKYPSASYLSSDPLIKRLFSQNDYNVVFREKFASDITKAFKARSLSKLRWILRYYTKTYSDHEYLSLFREGSGFIKGEITPSYSLLNAEDVQHIQHLFPDLKIILLLRNPIDRAWSHIRFSHMRDRISSIKDIDSLKQKIDSSSHELRGDYIRILDNWTSHFSQKQIFIGFFDDISSNPEKLMSDILSFLEVNTSDFQFGEALRTKRNVSTKRKMPKEIELHLAQKYQPMLKALADRVGGAAVSWLEQANHVIDKSTVSQ